MRKLLHSLLPIVLLASCTAGIETSHTSFSEHAENLGLPDVSAHYAARMQEPVNFRIYLDNSYSMNGYFNGATQFLSTVNRLVTDLSNSADDNNSACKLYYINNGINYYGNTSNARIDVFLSKINNFFAGDHKGNRGVTELKDVLNDVIDSVQQNSVSVVITDGIASPGLKGQDAFAYLTIMENSIYKSVYSKLAHCDFSTIIIKCSSDFNGTYINQLNKGIKYTGKQRPYYILIAGNQEAAGRVARLIKNSIPTSNYEGSYSLMNSQKQKIKTKVLVGADYDLSGNATALKIRRHRGANGNMHIRLLLDMKGLPVSEEYLLNPSSYKINPAGSKVIISKIENDQDPANKGYTHKMTIITNKAIAEQNINVQLKYDMPQWVYESSTEQDINIADAGFENKTFGLMYVVNGLQSGYKSRSMIDNYFALNIQLTN